MTSTYQADRSSLPSTLSLTTSSTRPMHTGTLRPLRGFVALPRLARHRRVMPLRDAAADHRRSAPSLPVGVECGLMVHADFRHGLAQGLQVRAHLAEGLLVFLLDLVHVTELPFPLPRTLLLVLRGGAWLRLRWAARPSLRGCVYTAGVKLLVSAM